LTPDVLRPAAFDAVGRLLDAVTEPAQAVAAHSPAYLVASRRPPLAEAENQFARLYAGRLTDAERQRFHFFTEPDFQGAIISRKAAFVAGMGLMPETAISLRTAGWAPAGAVVGATIWLPRRSGPSGP